MRGPEGRRGICNADNTAEPVPKGLNIKLYPDMFKLPYHSLTGMFVLLGNPVRLMYLYFTAVLSNIIQSFIMNCYFFLNVKAAHQQVE